MDLNFVLGGSSELNGGGPLFTLHLEGNPLRRLGVEDDEVPELTQGK